MFWEKEQERCLVLRAWSGGSAFYARSNFPEVGFVCHVLRLFAAEPSLGVGQKEECSLLLYTFFEENS